MDRSKFAGVALALSIAAMHSLAAHANPTLYTDRPSFESAIVNPVTDNFNSPAYSSINSAATMKSLSIASIGYESTFFSAPDWNLVFPNPGVDKQLCWGCNGSGKILLDDTTTGTSDGVFGFGVDVSNSSGSSLYAFVTFGDNSTQSFLLPLGPSFFGLTAAELVREIDFGDQGGGSTSEVDFFLDNVTIGAAAPTAIPTPGSLPLLGIALAGLGLFRRRKLH